MNKQLRWDHLFTNDEQNIDVGRTLYHLIFVGLRDFAVLLGVKND